MVHGAAEQAIIKVLPAEAGTHHLSAIGNQPLNIVHRQPCARAFHYLDDMLGIRLEANSQFLAGESFQNRPRAHVVTIVGNWLPIRLPDNRTAIANFPVIRQGKLVP